MVQRPSGFERFPAVAAAIPMTRLSFLNKLKLGQVRSGELDLLFRVFDTNRDGFLQLGEIVRQQEKLQPSLGRALAAARL